MCDRCKKLIFYVGLLTRLPISGTCGVGRVVRSVRRRPWQGLHLPRAGLHAGRGAHVPSQFKSDGAARFLGGQPVPSWRAVRRPLLRHDHEAWSSADAVVRDAALRRQLDAHHVRQLRRDDLPHRVPRRILLRHRAISHAGEET